MSIPTNVIFKSFSQEELETLCKENKLDFFLEICGALQKEEVKKVCNFLIKSANIEFDGNNETVWLLIGCPELRQFGAIGKPIKDETKRLMKMCFNEDDDVMKENFMTVLNHLRSLVGIY
jgi:hypothetical protein